MNTMSIRAAEVQKQNAWLSAAFARVVAALRITFEVFDEARRQADEAKRRYPFVL